mmetsp:Transcript_60699/g.119000  ORF Transcript_60699/g.119000 Transcript_60699/m.119000 type:complete len:203 (+) Transcript_60699:126-734(+)
MLAMKRSMHESFFWIPRTACQSLPMTIPSFRPSRHQSIGMRSSALCATRTRTKTAGGWAGLTTTPAWAIRCATAPTPHSSTKPTPPAPCSCRFWTAQLKSHGRALCARQAAPSRTCKGSSRTLLRLLTPPAAKCFPERSWRRAASKRSRPPTRPLRAGSSLGTCEKPPPKSPPRTPTRLCLAGCCGCTTARSPTSTPTARCC